MTANPLPDLRPITLSANYWLDTVLPIVTSAIPHQPDAMFTRFAAAIRERCKGVEEATLTSPPGRWSEIWQRICDEMWRNRDLGITLDDIEPFRQAIFLAVNGRPSAMAEKPLTAAERQHADEVKARMDADPDWPGYELEHAREPDKPATEQTLF